MFLSWSIESIQGAMPITLSRGTAGGQGNWIGNCTVVALIWPVRPRFHRFVATRSAHKMAVMSATKRPKPVQAVSSVFAEGIRAEMVYARDKHRTGFAIWKNGLWSLADRFVDQAGRTVAPYAPDNNLLTNNVVLFPVEPAAYGSQLELIDEVRAFIHRYVDVGDSFERIASYYVLLTWLYDAFNEVPYLRLRGEFGTGKTRFLQTVGSLCYRPIFTSGASTVSPLFHLLDMFGGTLILDEADFRYSDEKAEITKILNNGHVRGMPVLRSQLNRNREFNPHVFKVFGPKIIAMRGDFVDAALESRFITYETQSRPLRDDICISLPASYDDEATALRNKLLMYRFENWGRHTPQNELADPTLPPRTNQVLLPLLAIVDDERERELLFDILRAHHALG
jgi:hypothetical protein